MDRHDGSVSTTQTARKLLLDLADIEEGDAQSTATCVLKAARNTPAEVGELATECDVSRNTVYGTITPFIDAGFVDRNQDGYLLTGAGAIALRAFMRLNSRERSALAQMPSSTSRRVLLELLATEPATKSELDDQYDSLSYSAIRLAIDDFENRDLVCVNKSRRYELTDLGRTAIESERQVLEEVETVLDLMPFFRYTTTECDDFPIFAVDETWFVTGPKNRPRTERNNYLSFLASLDPTAVDQIRLFSAYYDHEMAKFYLEQFLSEGVQIDIISPQSALHNMPTDPHQLQSIRRALGADNLSWQLCPADVPIGLTLIDDHNAILYPRKPVGGQSTSGMLFTEDEEVITWAHEIFTAYEAKSKRPMQQILHTIWSLGVDLPS